MESSQTVADMKIQTFYCNPYRECTYILSDFPLENNPLGNLCVIIDPGMYGEKEEALVQAYLDTEHLVPTAVLITHTHPDHICGLEYLQRHYPELLIYGLDSNVCHSLIPNTHTLLLAGQIVTIILTPGHKKDSVCFYWQQQGILFSGDTLFKESIGRTDLPTGDMRALVQSLKHLSELPDETVVYPGHGLSTTIAYEKQFNP